MSGSGPAGELTFADLRARLRAVTQHVIDAEALADKEAADIAESRRAEADPDGGIGNVD